MIMYASKPGSPRFLFSLILASAALFFSCTGHIGYGVINWSVPEQNLAAADVVPVFIQSNIGKVYVVGVGKGKGTRIELPLWQVTLYKSKAQAKKAAQIMTDYRYTYASVKMDGLPIRAMPDNTAKLVYRLKLGQTIKILRKGEGVLVPSLEGDWLEVMTDDGSVGWCFSYNLTLFDERDNDASLETAGPAGPDTVLENILSRAWYPDSYRTMIADNRIDISRINPSWGFFTGRDSGIARIDSDKGVVTFPYTAIVRTEDGIYQFQGSTLTVQSRNGNSILVQYTDEKGMPQAQYYTSLDTTPEMLIEVESGRRADSLLLIRKAGPRFASGNYGVLQFLADGKFLWSGYQLLTPAALPAGAGAGGTVELRCFLSEGLATAYTGVLSFRFDSNPRWIHFLYNLTPQGLKLELVSDNNITDSVVLSQNLTPTIVFFTPEKAAQGGQ